MTQNEAEVVTLAEWLAAVSGTGPVWTKSSVDLNINLISFPMGQGVPMHVNSDVDVLVVVVRGEGLLELGDTRYHLRAGQVCVIPKGAPRAIQSRSSEFAYLTCHRRRGGLWPADQ
jgi:quercetin dioxygenase-like cupin family protein